MRCSWDVIWDKPAIEFLNILAYRKQKDETQRQAMERYRRKH